jgi:hypothetical protein
MGNSILNDQSADTLRMRKRQAKANGSAIILKIEDVACDPDGIGEMRDDVRDMVKRVGELLRVQSIAMTETRIVCKCRSRSLWNGIKLDTERISWSAWFTVSFLHIEGRRRSFCCGTRTKSVTILLLETTDPCGWTGSRGYNQQRRRPSHRGQSDRRRSRVFRPLEVRACRPVLPLSRMTDRPGELFDTGDRAHGDDH